MNRNFNPQITQITQMKQIMFLCPAHLSAMPVAEGRSVTSFPARTDWQAGNVIELREKYGVHHPLPNAWRAGVMMRILSSDTVTALHNNEKSYDKSV